MPVRAETRTVVAIPILQLAMYQSSPISALIRSVSSAQIVTRADGRHR
jgi:hypothetical protein